MNFLLAIYLVIIASYTEQALSVPAVNSRAMIAKAKNGEHTFSFVFRHFAATKDLGGMYRLLWSVTAKPDDRQDVYQLLLANDDDSELAENSYPLLRKIIRNSSGRGQAAYQNISLPMNYMMLWMILAIRWLLFILLHWRWEKMVVVLGRN